MSDVDLESTNVQQSASHLRRSSRHPQQSQKSSNLPSILAQPRQKAKKTLDHWLENPKSALTQINLTDIVNAQTWTSLSSDVRDKICLLLPPTAFTNFEHHLFRYQDDSTPARAYQEGSFDNDIDNSPGSQLVSAALQPLLDMSVFNDTHYMAAGRTFQDHLYSGWLTKPHLEMVRDAETALLNGDTFIPWKDEAWINEHAASTTSRKRFGAVSPSGERLSQALAGDAAEVKLDEIAQQIMKAGDIIAYKRAFTALNVVIRKDIFIEAIHPKSNALEVLIESGSAEVLPWDIIAPMASQDDHSAGFGARLLAGKFDSCRSRVQSVTVTTLSKLETAILDIDGRVEKTNRPNGNAWKTMSLWQWADTFDADNCIDLDNGKGGRECIGTLFYLRASYHRDK